MARLDWPGRIAWVSQFLERSRHFRDVVEVFQPDFTPRPFRERPEIWQNFSGYASTLVGDSYKHVLRSFGYCDVDRGRLLPFRDLTLVLNNRLNRIPQELTNDIFEVAQYIRECNILMP